jgi:hypothetical protein
MHMSRLEGKVPFVLFLCVVVLAELGCQTVTGPHSASGMSGQLYEIGAPVVSDGWTPPQLKAVKTLAISDSLGTVVQKVETDSSGSFHVFLPPGIYTVRVLDRFPQRKNGPFVVPKDKMIDVKIYHDNGMR